MRAGDQIRVPVPVHSSTTSGSASLMSLRRLLRVCPRQSPSSAILFEMSSDAGWPWLAPDFFMLGSAMMANDDSTTDILRSGYILVKSYFGDQVSPRPQGFQPQATESNLGRFRRLLPA